ncbi:sensor histidine kinase [Paenibacillaceae bacterium]|nr:sensor histidine kinase [Paenibacillaceae bacterium]
MPLPSKRRIRLSFKSKLFLSYIVIVLLPVSVSVLWMYDRLVEPVYGERLQAIDSSMSQMRNNISNELDTLEKTGYLISTNIVLKNFLIRTYYDQAELIVVMNTSIRSLLSWFKATHDEAGEFHFFTRNETVPESDFFRHASAVQGEPWFEQMKEAIVTGGYPYWESSHKQRSDLFGRSGHRNVYSMFYPINEDFPNDTSYLEFQIDSDILLHQANEPLLPPSSLVLAVDWNGSVVTASRQAQPAADKLATDQAFRELGLHAETSGTFTHQGVKYHYFAKPVDRLQTSLVGLIPVAEIEHTWIRTRNTFLALLALAGLLLAGLSYLLAGLLIKKILRIVSSVRKMQNGDFKVRIHVKGEDEVDVLAHNINSMAAQIDELINRVYKSQLARKEAELHALQAQINPHFLFNTLETLRMMAEAEDQPELSDAITALGSIMRYNIYNGHDSVAIATELEHIADYIQIQNLLLNNRIVLHISAPEALSSYPIPNLFLQPLVENCIVHGKRSDGSLLTIAITIEQAEDDAIRCIVQDNGCGMEPARLARVQQLLDADPELRKNMQPAIMAAEPATTAVPQGSGGRKAEARAGGVGLLNVSDRIRWFEGSSSELHIASAPGEGTTVTIMLRS